MACQTVTSVHGDRPRPRGQEPFTFLDYPAAESESCVLSLLVTGRKLILLACLGATLSSLPRSCHCGLPVSILEVWVACDESVSVNKAALHLWVGLLLGIETLHTPWGRCRPVDSNETLEAVTGGLTDCSHGTKDPRASVTTLLGFGLFVCFFVFITSGLIPKRMPETEKK